MTEAEREFLEKLKRGDSTSFALLISNHSQNVIHTCYRFLLNREDAEDIAQEVFLEVYQSLPRFRGDAKLSTWIYRIAVTKCLDELKKRKRKKRISSLGKLLHVDDVVSGLGGGSPADQRLRENESMKEIAEALDSLPENQRVAFTLSKIEGYSNPEIAAIMETTTVAVESLIYRAKKAMGEKLEQILKNSAG